MLAKITSGLPKMNWKQSLVVWKRIKNIKFPATRVYVEDGGLIPRGFGFAYYDFIADVDVYYVFPLNWFVWFWRNHLRYWLLRPPRDQILGEAYRAGVRMGRQKGHHFAFNEGYEKGFAVGYAACTRETLQRFDTFVEERKKEQ